MSSQKPSIRALLPALTPLILAVLALGALPAAAGAEAACPNEQLRQENNSTSLPDCRAYELVTPPFTDGQPTAGPALKIATDGSRISYSSLGGFGEAGDDGNGDGTFYTDPRGPAGWESTPLAPPARLFQTETPRAYLGSGLSFGLSEAFYTLVPASSKPIDFRYYRVAPGAEPVEVGPTVAPSKVASWTVAEGEKTGGYPHPAFRGATRDLSHILFTQEGVNYDLGTKYFWPGDPTTGVYSLYEYSGVANSEPVLVDIAPGPRETEDHPVEKPAVISQCGAMLGGANGSSSGEPLDMYNAISSLPAAEEGRVVFFTAFAAVRVACAGPPVNELYARIEGRRTVAISEPSQADCEACVESSPADGLFQGASQDGSRVFFLSEQQLFGGARGEAGDNLYEYDFDAANPHEKVSLIAPDMAPSELGGAATPGGVMRVSEDGSRVYFVSNAVLAGATENEYGVHAAAGAENLYVYDTVAHRATFIAALAETRMEKQEWRATNGRGSVEVTPDGRYLLLGSSNDITSDASGSAQQLYRYDSQPSKAEEEAHVPRLIRVSIGDPASKHGNNSAPSEIPEKNYTIDLATPRPISISNDGSRVFFESSGALTPGALDEVCAFAQEGGCVKALNVYEWEGGRVYLISDGRDVHSAFRGSAVGFLGASADGSDVFFTGVDSLTAGEAGSSGQRIFDARVDGGFPGAPAPQVCVAGCQGPGPAAPAGAAPASTVSSEAGAMPLLPAAVSPGSRPLTRAQRLRKALKACAGKRDRRRRRACEARARRVYGHVSATRRSVKRVGR